MRRLVFSTSPRMISISSFLERVEQKHLVASGFVRSAVRAPSRPAACSFCDEILALALLLRRERGLQQVGAAMALT